MGNFRLVSIVLLPGKWWSKFSWNPFLGTWRRMVGNSHRASYHRAVDITHISFRQAFDTVFQNTVSKDADLLRFRWTTRCVQNYSGLELKGSNITWRLVTTAVPLESVLRPVLFDVCIGDLEEMTMTALSRDTNLDWFIAIFEDRAGSQSSLNKLEEWNNRKFYEILWWQSQVVHLGRRSPWKQHSAHWAWDSSEH